MGRTVRSSAGASAAACARAGLVIQPVTVRQRYSPAASATTSRLRLRVIFLNAPLCFYECYMADFFRRSPKSIILKAAAPANNVIYRRDSHAMLSRSLIQNKFIFISFFGGLI